jgi:tetratricopeptide (TPR) repeat protein
MGISRKRCEEAKQAIAHFRECLTLDPRAWAYMWGMGKAEQALGNHREALGYFEGAAAIETGNADVWREAAIAASALGEAQKAVQYGTAALKLRPTDAGLHANAAVAFLLAGDDDQTEHLASRALDLDPADAVNRRVLELVRAVRSGARERPRSL